LLFRPFFDSLKNEELKESFFIQFGVKQTPFQDEDFPDISTQRNETIIKTRKNKIKKF
jgi:hypothetical protein